MKWAAFLLGKRKRKSMKTIEPGQMAELVTAAKPFATKVGIGGSISLLGIGINEWVSVLSAVYVVFQIVVFCIRNRDLIKNVFKKKETDNE